jgi:hypothetical protein
LVLLLLRLCNRQMVLLGAYLDSSWPIYRSQGHFFEDEIEVFFKGPGRSHYPTCDSPDH